MNEKGKTLWEMLMERVHGSNGSGVPFYNPLGTGVGNAFAVPYSNGADFANYDFSIQEIREYNRRIGGQEFRFTDYVLRGVSTKSFSAEDTLVARVRAVPNPAGAHDDLLLCLEDEFAFAEDFLNVVKDDTGLFEVRDDESGAVETFHRLNNLRGSYQAAVLQVSATTPDGKATSGKTTLVKVEYWDYWRDVELTGGKTAKEFLFVEMNSDNGWFQIWRGREFFA